jgi:hypothetical protein
MRNLWCVIAAAMALFAVPALGQTTASSVQAPAGYAPMSAPCIKQVDGTCVPVSTANPQPMTSVAASAASTAATGTVTTTSATATSGTTPAFSSGTATISFTPARGYPVRVVLDGGAAWTGYLGTSVNGCTSIHKLTSGGVATTYSQAAGGDGMDEYLDLPPTTVTSSFVYCLVLTVTSGTETYAVRN